MISVHRPGRAAALRRRLAALAPPDDLLQRVRWSLLAFSLASGALLAALVPVAGSARPLQQVVAQAALLVLAWRWVTDYRGGRRHPAWEVVEAALLLTVGVAAPSPLTVLLLLYTRLATRVMDRDGGRVAWVTACYLAAYAGSAVLSPAPSTSATRLEYFFLGSAFPLVAVVMHLLGEVLRRVEVAGRRERAVRDELQRRMDEGVRESEANFRRLFESNPQPMWVYDAETHVFLAVNDAAVDHYGYRRDEFLRMTIFDLRTAAEARRLREALREHGDLGKSSGWRHRTKDGRFIDVETTAHRLTFADRNACFVLVRDVTEELKLAEELRRQAFHDSLTGLPNRALLDDRASQALRRWRRRRNKPPVMLVLDLDGFKAVNDSVGHAHGDEVIAAVGARLLAFVRPGDTAARLGGDEFAVLLDDIGDFDEAVAVARRLIDVLREPYPMGSRTVSISACAGIAVAGDPGTTVAGLLSDADIAMYVAKARGTGSLAVFTPEDRAAQVDRMRLEEDLAHALDRGQLSVVYQPQLDLGSNRVTAVEALARWTHPTRGAVPPDVFIPIAEQIGLVTEIDAFVLRTVCQALERWGETGLHSLRVAVNLSGRDLDSEDLVGIVRRALVDCRLDPWLLELELTEGVAVSRPEAAVQRLQELRALGVRVAIDDFGVGYSMFSRLRELPIDRIKIDRSFVRDLDSDDDTAAIVGSTIAMGHALGLTLIAEGVETAVVLARLRDLGCDSVQGYHICHPLAEEQLLSWLETSGWAASPPRQRAAPAV